MAPPSLLQAEIHPILPRVSEAPAQDVKETRAGGGNGDDAQLRLVGPEIPSGEPILPSPLDCSHLPIVVFVHIGGAPDPASQQEAAKVLDAGDVGAEEDMACLKLDGKLVTR